MNTQIMTVSKQEMIIASYAISRSNDNFFAALQMSKCNELVYRLRTGIVHGYFQKKDGTLREFWGTTNPSLASKKTVYPIGIIPFLFSFSLNPGEFALYKPVNGNHKTKQDKVKPKQTKIKRKQTRKQFCICFYFV